MQFELLTIHLLLIQEPPKSPSWPERDSSGRDELASRGRLIPAARWQTEHQAIGECEFCNRVPALSSAKGMDLSSSLGRSTPWLGLKCPSRRDFHRAI